MKKILIAFIAFLVVLSPYSINIPHSKMAKAEGNIISGTISGNPTWELADSPYLIIDESIYIEPGAVLTIEPGVIVKLAYADIEIGGQLIANGTANQPIIFTSNFDDEHGGDASPGSSQSPQPGDWGSLYISEGARAELDYAKIYYGGDIPSQVEKIDNNFFQPLAAYAYAGGDMGVIQVQSRGEAMINNSEIVNNNFGIRARNATVTISNSKIDNNSTGLLALNGRRYDPVNRQYIYFCDSLNVNITNSEITSNAGAGIENNTDCGINAISNWWGDNTGPYNDPDNVFGLGNAVYGNVSYYPWIVREQKRNPVIIVPGIMGSYLNRTSDGEEIWPDLSKMIISPSDDYLNELILPTSGMPENINMLPSNIISQIMCEDFFQGLINELVQNGYKEGKNLFVFPYDWRLDISVIAGGSSTIPGILTLNDKINLVKRVTNSEKVDIIAHSMGGLVVKKYIYNYGQNNIDKFIDIATPHYGAPKAFKTLQYGDNMGFKISGVDILNPKRVKIISRNFPSIYQLLPSFNYFDQTNDYYQYYIYDAFVQNKALDYNQSIDFLKLSGQNWNLLDNAINIHNDTDNLSVNNSYNIIGCGVPTIGAIKILNSGSDENDYRLAYINGDGTVPFHSADGLSTDKKYYVNGVEHAGLPSDVGTRELISAILDNKTDQFDYTNYSNLSVDDTRCPLNGRLLGIHSPLELHIYDKQGNHTGPNSFGDIEMNIPGISYDIIEGNKFAFLPTGGDYTIIGRATAVGEFSMDVQDIVNDEYKDMAYFNDVAIPSTSTTIALNFSGNQNIQNINIQKDNNGDGVSDEIINSSTILNEEAADDLDPPQTTINLKGDAAGNENIFYGPITLEFSATDSLAGVLKTEYSVNGTSSWVIYDANSKPVLKTPGEYIVYYLSIDKAGNRELIKKAVFEIKERDCLGSLVKLISDLNNQGEIKKPQIEEQLINKFNLLKKFIEKFVNRPSDCRHQLCREISKLIDKANKKIIEADMYFIIKEIKLYKQKGWITSEASAIIINKLICVNNYLK